MNVKKNLSGILVGAACAALLAGPAYAAGEMSGKQKTQQQSSSAWQQKSGSVAYESEKLIGHKVVNKQGENLGEITNLAIGDDGRINYAVLSTGGIMGVGGKEVAIPFSQLNLALDEEDRIVLDVSKDRVQSEFAAFEDIREQSRSTTQQRKQEKGGMESME